MPALKELKQFTDIKASYSVYEKSGKTITKIKFKISPNSKSFKKENSAKAFLEKIENTSKEGIDLTDPIYNNEIYQMMVEYGVNVQSKVRKIVNRCSEEGNYKSYVTETIERCKKDFERNPNIENKGGYILAAIETDYYKKQRKSEQEQAQKEADKKAEQAEQIKIESLVQEGIASFLIWRKPFINMLREEHLNNAVVQSVIEDNTKNEVARRKAWKGFVE